MLMRTTMTTLTILGMLVLPPAGHAAPLTVAPGESIQAAIDAATAGDTITVAAGTYRENLDFKGKAIAVVGAGPDTIVQGDGTDSVVRFTSGEGRDSVLDSLTITGGVAAQGGGIYVASSSPTILRTVITRNQAANGGSGVFIDGTGGVATPELRNNLLTFNTTSGGDPHGLQILSATPVVINNTLFGSDSNAIHLSGSSRRSIIMNNVISYNGAVIDGGRRGRGICDFSPGGTFTQYNVFWANRVGALLTAGTNFARIRTAERILGREELVHNYDRTPGFVRRNGRRQPLDLRLRAKSPIRNMGNPDPVFNDRDGSRNDPGYTGGPFASTLGN